ncbi:hypothetical protein KFK09_003612 [Dendrobium nobile]|uniref:Uncharacterized protein n=1 Tax=Dendrobium nobile TaxID=94219 RepID=A0A8T3C3I1_DENNO|nr:hypothetical protein KFK09_003612 [Dendrobium nobile]
MEVGISTSRFGLCDIAAKTLLHCRRSRFLLLVRLRNPLLSLIWEEFRSAVGITVLESGYLRVILAFRREFRLHIFALDSALDYWSLLENISQLMEGCNLLCSKNNGMH